MKTPKSSTDIHTALNSDSIAALLEKDGGNYDEVLKRLAVREKFAVLMEEEARNADKARQMEASLRATQEEIEGRERNQAQCLHTKQNGRASVVGQRASHGRPIYLCQNCQKTWADEELPGYLAGTMSDVMIGGPA